jgi:hypothetical protein
LSEVFEASLGVEEANGYYFVRALGHSAD